MDKYIGRLLDNRYEILEEIGSGGMAVVYRARCHRLNRLVAIKILKDEYSRDDEFRRRFQAESQAVAMLSHPNIVSVYDVSRSDDIDYIVMELIDGLTLKQYMEQKGQLSWRETLHFAAQIAKALEHAHSRGIIHRDIKPHNIMVLKDGSVKVADFGIARVSSSQNTLTREALGSVHYISPEQAKGGRVDERTDLYSLGVVMYEMLTGRPPYDGETPVSVAIQHINSAPVPPSLLNSEVPKGLEQIVLHAMAADLDKRYASATEMIRDMEEFRKNPAVTFTFDGAVSRVELPPAARQPARAAAPRHAERAGSAERKKRSAPMFAATVCIVLAVLGILYFLYAYFLRDLISGSDDVTVPSLVGLVYEDLSRADYPDFTIVYGGAQTSDDYPTGYIIDQSPRAKRTAKAGSEITVIVSSGPLTAAMPELYRASQSEAVSTLNGLDLGLNLRVHEEPTTDAALVGRIIRYTPDSGTRLSDGDTVEIWIGTAAVSGADGAGNTGGESPDTAVKPPETTDQPDDTPDDPDAPNDPAPEEPDAPVQPPETDGDGDTGGEEGPVAPVRATKTVSVTIPAGEGSATVTIKLDGATTGEYVVELLPEQTERQFLIEGAGEQQLDVYIDGVLTQTRTVAFS